MRHCDAALARAFGFLGKRWSGVILGTLANGESGFAELKRRVEGISDSVLSDRLAELQGAGLISSRRVGPTGFGVLHTVRVGQGVDARDV